eukprot:TRINITY_DN3217_c0_g2_i1.p1 TRINITY_DN3217_c0_g2~~TRINITY_DN3217_c0_g2_i1.p1  ORF type:complete len:235 (+),score=27.75 TRINITY_DN3217_c0_g2_i1:239-943(+)
MSGEWVFPDKACYAGSAAVLPACCAVNMMRAVICAALAVCMIHTAIASAIVPVESANFETEAVSINLVVPGDVKSCDSSPSVTGVATATSTDCYITRPGYATHGNYLVQSWCPSQYIRPGVENQCSPPASSALAFCDLHPECLALTCNLGRSDCQVRTFPLTGQVLPGYTSYEKQFPAVTYTDVVQGCKTVRTWSATVCGQVVTGVQTITCGACSASLRSKICAAPGMNTAIGC